MSPIRKVAGLLGPARRPQADGPGHGRLRSNGLLDRSHSNTCVLSTGGQRVVAICRTEVHDPLNSRPDA